MAKYAAISSASFSLPSSTIILCMGTVALILSLCSCGENEEDSKNAQADADIPTALPMKSSKDSSSSVNGKSKDPNKTFCKQKCEYECSVGDKDIGAYLAKKKAIAAKSPFTLSISRAYFKGACAKGDVPQRRKSTGGISAIVEGHILYTGDDMLIDASLDGGLFMNVDQKRYAVAPALSRSNQSIYSKKSTPSDITRPVRGEDPWLKGQKRPFHFESKPLNPAFCEIVPKSVVSFLELKTEGIVSGVKTTPLHTIEMQWDEVVGMSLRQQISILKSTGQNVSKEPADAHYSKLDKILVTRLTGDTQWIDRKSTVGSDKMKRGIPASFPAEATSDDWKISVNDISSKNEFGGYAPKGEDMFLVVVDLKITNKSNSEASAGQIAARLEMAPGKWAKPVRTALGQVDTSQFLDAKTSISGKMVFQRQRFERPFRLEVKVPDGNTLYLDIFNYDLGPSRSPLK